MILPHTIDLLTASVTTDRRHNEVESWESPSVEQVQAYVQPAEATEAYTLTGDRLIVGFVAFCERQGITARQRVRWDGQTYLIDGKPAEHIDPTGTYRHTTLRLRKVER